MKLATKLVTVKMAAEQLGISRKRVALLCQEGTIKAEKVGARLYILDPHSLDEYARSETRKHRPYTLSPGRPPTPRKKKKKRA